MEVLGNTLGAIAGEKAGILKPGADCFTAAQEPEAMQSLEEAAARVRPDPFGLAPGREAPLGAGSILVAATRGRA